MSVGINTIEWAALSTDWVWDIGVGGDWVIHSSQEWEEYWLHGWIKALELLMNHRDIQGRNFAVATSLGASSWRGPGCWGTQKPSLTWISERTCLRAWPVITAELHVPFFWYQPWGALMKARDCIFIRNISHQGSMFGVLHGSLLSWRPAKSRGSTWFN